MIVVHAALLDNQLVAWGESPRDPTTASGGEAAPGPRESRPRKGRSQAEPRGAPAVNPYDAGATLLAEALSQAVLGWSISARSAATFVAWLPTIGGNPVASSPLVADTAQEPQGTGKAKAEPGPTSAPWAISGFVLSPEQALDLLSAAIGRTTLAQGVVVGGTLTYWAAVLKFAAAIVARQQFLPGIVQQPARTAPEPKTKAMAGRARAPGWATSYHARWEPVIAGADAQRLAQLVRGLPAACRALGHAEDQGPPTRSAADAVASILGMMVDHLVRASAAGRTRPARFDSLHDQWIHALRAGDDRLEGQSAELEQLAEQVARWRRPITVATDAPLRLCFRLEEPPDEDEDEDAQAGRAAQHYEPAPDGWTVRYLVQAADDPSLIVPVSGLWRPGSRESAMLQHVGAARGFQPREFLLEALGRAAGLDPRIEASLQSKSPGEYRVDTRGAYEFLGQKAWLLEQAGFGVMLPAWWGRKGTKLRLSARAQVQAPKLRSQAGLSLDEILRFQWQVALGDQVLSYEELEALARLKSPLVKIRGQWVQLSAEEIQAALAFWKKKEDEPVSAREAVRMALGLAQPPGGLDYQGIEASGWLADLLQQLQGQSTFETLEPPQGLQGTLRPYQVRGYSWLGFLRRWGFGACLADDMGLGKTVQTLALIQREWESQEGEVPAHGTRKRRARIPRRPTLLICPMSVVGNWAKEAARFTPGLPVMVHHGIGRLKGAAFKKTALDQALVLSSYGLLNRDQALFRSVPWWALVLDEAQNVKNPQTKQAQAARSLPADCRIALTGTPVENHVGDLWSIMEFLNPGLLGSQAQFKRSFHIPIQVHRDPEAARRLQSLTGPFILRRLKTDKAVIADLPDKLEMTVFCTLTQEQGSLYQAVVDESIHDLEQEATEGIRRKGVVLATLTKLKQVCNHPAQFLGDNSVIPGRSGKLARLAEMLEEVIEIDERALIFTQFAEMGGILRRHLEETFGCEVLFLHGGVPKGRRDRMVERFQSSSDGRGPRLFVLSLKAGGTGLNLTAANHVFHFDRWWNPAVESQATDRAFRIGQKQNVQVHKFVCAGTVEEKIDEMIENKRQIAGAIVGTGEDWLTKLSTEELKDLLALRREALAE